ncbi:Protein O-mannosyl-transferase TMTC4 [Lamellibrachia satsuma]|nr:Protein O-mannosyl-transferase TMTC4 [Lamellibrachia satsuma]
MVHKTHLDPDVKPLAWDSHLPVPKLSFTTSAAVVFIAAILCFANSYDADFVFDDSEAILNNHDLKPETTIGTVFTHDFWGQKVTSNTSHKSYRPLTVLTFKLNALVAGGLHPRGFHVINILLHAVVSVVFLRVFSVLLGGAQSSQGAEIGFTAPRASFLCGVLFAVHPIHTEAVAGVVGRADLLCALSFLLSFLSYIESTKGCYYSASSLVLPRQPFSLPWLLISMLLCAVAVLCKEQGITVLGVCSAYDILIVRRLDVIQVLGLRTATKNKSMPVVNARLKLSQQQWRSLLVRHLILCVTGVVILLCRWRIMGSTPPVFQEVDNPHSFINGTLFRTLNYNYLYALNSWILLCPQWLCFDWSMGCVPVITMVTDTRLLVVFLFWACLCVLLYQCLVVPPSRQQRLLTMSLAMVVIPFLPATNLFFRVGFVIAERVLYLSSAGGVMLVVLGASALSSGHAKLTQLCLVLLVTVFTARSIQRSQVWKTEKTLFDSGATVCPLNAKVHYNIAKVYGDAGHIKFAMSKYRTAIGLNPNYDQAMNNLANLLKEKGEHVEAESLLRKAVSLRPSFAAAWMNLGIVEAALGKVTNAETSYQMALIHRRKYPDCYYNLGNLYLDEGRHKEALVAWRNATLQKQTHVNAWNNMAILLGNLDRLDELHLMMKEALTFNPQDAALHYNYASALGKAEMFPKSEAHFLKAIEMSPEIVRYHTNLGVLYHRWGKLDQAEAAYQRALQLEPSSTQVQENLQMLYRKKAKQ